MGATQTLIVVDCGQLLLTVAFGPEIKMKKKMPNSMEKKRRKERRGRGVGTVG